MGIFERRRIRQYEAARDAAAASLSREMNGPPLAVALATDLGLGGKPIVVAVTDEEILWVLVDMPDIVMRQRLEQVTVVEQEGSLVKLTESDSEYARSLGDPSNPRGDTDFVFQLPESEDGFILSRQLNVALFRHSPVFSERRSHIIELKRRQTIPIAEWTECPYCGRSFAARVPGAVTCTSCFLCFCDPDIEPIISEATETYGHVVGTKPWLPLLETMIILRGKRVPWVYRPAGRAMGPTIIPGTEDVELMHAIS